MMRGIADVGYKSSVLTVGLRDNGEIDVVFPEWVIDKLNGRAGPEARFHDLDESPDVLWTDAFAELAACLRGRPIRHTQDWLDMIAGWLAAPLSEALSEHGGYAVDVVKAIHRAIKTAPADLDRIEAWR